jgi:hypothetical protein
LAVAATASGAAVSASAGDAAVAASAGGPTMFLLEPQLPVVQHCV